MQFAKHYKKSEKITSSIQGFTIVELLIVIVVVGILAAVTMVAYGNVQSRAKVSQKRVEISHVTKASTIAATVSQSVVFNDSQTLAENRSALTSLGLTNYDKYVADSGLTLNSNTCTNGARGMTKDKYCVSISTDDNLAVYGSAVWWHDLENQWYITYFYSTGQVTETATGWNTPYPQMMDY